MRHIGKSILHMLKSSSLSGGTTPTWCQCEQLIIVNIYVCFYDVMTSRVGAAAAVLLIRIKTFCKYLKGPHDAGFDGLQMQHAAWNASSLSSLALFITLLFYWQWSWCVHVFRDDSEDIDGTLQVSLRTKPEFLNSSPPSWPSRC